MEPRAIIFLSLLTSILFFSPTTHAERYTPEDPHTVIATWPIASAPELQRAQAEKRLKPDDPTAVVSLANNYLALASMPGESRLYGLAQATLKPLVDAKTENVQVWLAWAQVLQHQHAFDEALVALDNVLIRDPKNVSANLLAARIYLIQDNATKARQMCLALLGNSDLLTTSACVLEVTSHQSNQLDESYEQLVKLVNREGLPDDQRGSWILQILADMALRLGKNKAAEDWLAMRLQNASVNYLAQWADTQFAQGRPQNVIDYLVPLVNVAPEIDDLLLLQLALAEKTIMQASPQISNEKQWFAKLAERIQLREQRQDNQHANEIARYYLDIDPQPQKALYWAQIHWQHSRESNDKKLLARAQAAVDGQSTILPGESQ